MITTIISTVGTSLLGNLKRPDTEPQLRQLYDAENWAGLARELVEAPEEEVEPIRALLGEAQVDGKHLWELAPIGQIFLEGFRQRYPLEKTLPAAVPETERKAPTFGNDHHLPRGFELYVNEIWQATPYIATCRATSYVGKRQFRTVLSK